MIHEFRLYRSGWADGLPFPDNQLWASCSHDLLPDAAPDADRCVVLDPMYGHAASWYRVFLAPLESPEEGWTSYRAMLVIDSCKVGPGYVPLAWYTGAPSDWPSGLARYPETYGAPQIPQMKRTFGEPDPRGVWTLAVRRDQ